VKDVAASNLPEKHPNLRGASSASGKGHEEGGLTYAKAGSSLRSLPGNSRAIYPPKALDTVAFLQRKGVVGYNKKKN